jgi:hypothetical protein
MRRGSCARARIRHVLLRRQSHWSDDIIPSSTFDVEPSNVFRRSPDCSKLSTRFFLSAVDMSRNISFLCSRGSWRKSRGNAVCRFLTSVTERIAPADNGVARSRNETPRGNLRSSSPDSKRATHDAFRSLHLLFVASLLRAHTPFVCNVTFNAHGPTTLGLRSCCCKERARLPDPSASTVNVRA